MQSTNCSVYAARCLNEQVFSSDVVLCALQDSLLKNYTIAPSNKLEVVAVNHVCFSKSGRQMVHFDNINITHFKSGDMFALHFPASNSLSIATRPVPSTQMTKGSAVITYTQPNTGLGTIIAPSGSVISLVEYSIVLLTKITCQSKLPIVYSAIGNFTEKVTVKSASRSQDYSQSLTVLSKIAGVSWEYRPGAVVNEPFSVFVSVQNGTGMTAILRFGNITSQSLTWTAAYAEHTFVHTFTQRKSETLSLVISNGASVDFKECTIKVQTRVGGLAFTEPIKPVVYPAVTYICFKLTHGDEVTIEADYGNNVKAVNGTYDIKDMFIGCFNHSHEVGVYDVGVIASNDASNQTISQLVIVEKVILGFTCVVEQQFVHEHIEVNETICLRCTITQGTI